MSKTKIISVVASAALALSMIPVISAISGRATATESDAIEHELSITDELDDVTANAADNDDVADVMEFSYTGATQEVSLDSGVYVLELWGGSGSKSMHGAGSNGGYSKGTYTVNKRTTIYVAVGGEGRLVTHGFGGWNGGGTPSNPVCATDDSGGGGATHIAFKDGTLASLVNDKESVLIVAGGGGGGGCSSCVGGAGGGANMPGNDATGSHYGAPGGGGQLDGVANLRSATATAGFGFGGYSLGLYGSGSGGGGWYGGQAGNNESGGGNAGGGGSGYANTELLTDIEGANGLNLGNGKIRITQIARPELYIDKVQSVNSGERTSMTKDVEAGDVIEYALTVYNHGNGMAGSYVIEDRIPDGLAYVEGSASDNGTVSGNTVTWDLESLDFGSSREVTFKVEVPPTRTNITWTNTATASCRSTTRSTEQVQVVKQGAANIVMTKSQALESAAPDGSVIDSVANNLISYTIHIENDGDGAARDLIVKDVVDQGLSIDASSISNSGTAAANIITWDLGSLQPGADMDVRYVVSVPTSDIDQTWSDGATATYSDANKQQLTATSNSTSSEKQGEAAIKLSATQALTPDGWGERISATTSPIDAKASDAIDIAISGKNEGTGPARDVWLTIDIPAGAKIKSVPSDGGMVDGASLSWRIGEVAEGASFARSASFIIPSTENRADWDMTAQSFLRHTNSNDFKASSSNTLVITKDGRAHLDAVMQQAIAPDSDCFTVSSIDDCYAGDVIVYCLDVANNGVGTAHDIEVSTKVPADFALISQYAQGEEPDMKELAKGYWAEDASDDEDVESPAKGDYGEEAEDENPISSLASFIAGIFANDAGDENGASSDGSEAADDPGEAEDDSEGTNEKESDHLFPTNDDSEDLSWEIGDLAPGENSILYFAAKVPETDLITTWSDDFTATYTHVNSRERDSIDSNVVQITKDGLPAPVIDSTQFIQDAINEPTQELIDAKAGDVITYETTITNNGISRLRDGIVEMTVPEGTDLDADSIEVIRDVDGLDPDNEGDGSERGEEDADHSPNAGSDSEEPPVQAMDAVQANVTLSDASAPPLFASRIQDPLSLLMPATARIDASTLSMYAPLLASGAAPSSAVKTTRHALYKDRIDWSQDETAQGLFNWLEANATLSNSNGVWKDKYYGRPTDRPALTSSSDTFDIYRYRLSSEGRPATNRAGLYLEKITDVSEDEVEDIFADCIGWYVTAYNAYLMDHPEQFWLTESPAFEYVLEEQASDDEDFPGLFTGLAGAPEEPEDPEEPDPIVPKVYTMYVTMCVDSNGNTLRSSYYTEAKISSDKKVMEDMFTELSTQHSGDLINDSDYAYALLFSQWIADNTVIGNASDGSASGAGAVLAKHSKATGFAVASAMKYLLDSKGIDCAISCQTTPTQRYWNIVKLDDKWYAFDTASLQSSGKDSKYAGMGKTTLSKYISNISDNAFASYDASAAHPNNEPLLDNDDFQLPLPTCVPPELTAPFGTIIAVLDIPNPDANTPGTWAWQSPLDVCDRTGKMKFKATFTPDDLVTYCKVSDIDVTVNVTAATGGVTAQLEITYYRYDGQEKRPTVIVRYNNGASVMDASYYTVEYENNIEIGTGYAIVTANEDCPYDFDPIRLPFIITSASQGDITLVDNAPEGRHSYGDVYQLTASGGAVSGRVSYSLVSGPATVTPEGQVRANSVGDVTIKATKTADGYEPVEATFSFKILPRQLEVSDLVADDKAYDASVVATCQTPALSNILDSDAGDVRVSASVKFEDPSVGNNKKVEAVYAISGAKAYLYYAPTPNSSTASITKATLQSAAKATVSDVTVADATELSSVKIPVRITHKADSSRIQGELQWKADTTQVLLNSDSEMREIPWTFTANDPNFSGTLEGVARVRVLAPNEKYDPSDQLKPYPYPDYMARDEISINEEGSVISVLIDDLEAGETIVLRYNVSVPQTEDPIFYEQRSALTYGHVNTRGAEKTCGAQIYASKDGAPTLIGKITQGALGNEKTTDEVTVPDGSILSYDVLITNVSDGGIARAGEISIPVAPGLEGLASSVKVSEIADPYKIDKELCEFDIIKSIEEKSLIPLDQLSSGDLAEDNGADDSETDDEAASEDENQLIALADDQDGQGTADDTAGEGDDENAVTDGPNDALDDGSSTASNILVRKATTYGTDAADHYTIYHILSLVCNFEAITGYHKVSDLKLDSIPDLGDVKDDPVGAPDTTATGDDKVVNVADEARDASDASDDGDEGASEDGTDDNDDSVDDPQDAGDLVEPELMRLGILTDREDGFDPLIISGDSDASLNSETVIKAQIPDLMPGESVVVSFDAKTADGSDITVFDHSGSGTYMTTNGEEAIAFETNTVRAYKTIEQLVQTGEQAQLVVIALVVWIVLSAGVIMIMRSRLRRR